MFAAHPTSVIHQPATAPATAASKMETRGLVIRYGQKAAVKGVSLALPERQVMALIGPSGCGKSTFLRALNRMNELIPGASHDGEILLDGRSVYDRHLDAVELRRKVGMVFQKSNPFPKSIFENVAYGLRVSGMRERTAIAERVERSLRSAALWEEVQDRLEVLLMDEPASALDPIATAKIEDLVHELKARYTIVIVTHNMQQAARVSDRTAFFYMGELVEVGPTEEIFTNPHEQRTEDYVTGKFG